MGKIKSQFDLKGSRLAVGVGRERERERESEGWRASRELENREAFERGSCDLWLWGCELKAEVTRELERWERSNQKKIFVRGRLGSCEISAF